jgi:hypothetical protein
MTFTLLSLTAVIIPAPLLPGRKVPLIFAHFFLVSITARSDTSENPGPVPGIPLSRQFMRTINPKICPINLFQTNKTITQ